MDKGTRRDKEKIKQKQRLKNHYDPSWMDSGQIGILKNHDKFHIKDPGFKDKHIYVRPKYKKIDDLSEE